MIINEEKKYAQMKLHRLFFVKYYKIKWNLCELHSIKLDW